MTKKERQEQQYQEKRQLKSEVIEEVAEYEIAKAEAQKKQGRSPYKEWTQLNNIQIERFIVDLRARGIKQLRLLI